MMGIVGSGYGGVFINLDMNVDLPAAAAFPRAEFVVSVNFRIAVDDGADRAEFIVRQLVIGKVGNRFYRKVK